jgi:hypothetical protein
VGAILQFLNGTANPFQSRVISATSTTTSPSVTVNPAFGVAPNPGDRFTVTAFEQAGTGQSTFVTDSGPSVLTHNTFGTVISDFATEIFPGVGIAGVNFGPFGYTWQTFPPGTFGSPFP